MDNIMVAMTTIGAIVLGGTEMVKKTSVDNKYLPFINVILGVIIGLIWGLSFAPNELVVYAWGGLLAGMSSGGFYDGVSNTGAIINEKKSETYIEEDKGLQDTRGDE